MRKLLVVAAVLASGLAAPLATPVGAHGATGGGVIVSHPWLRATSAGASVGAAFMEIRAGDGTVDRLIAAESAVAGRVEIHGHTRDGDVVRMRRLEGIDLKGGESHVLKPGGDHVMLMDLRAPLKEGDLVTLTLNFEKAGRIEVEGTVEPVGALGPHGMDRQPGLDDEKSGPVFDHSGHN